MTTPWFFSPQHNSPCKVIETQQLWGQEVCRVWLSSQDAVVLVPRDALCDFAPLDAPTAVAHIKYVAAAAKVAQILNQSAASTLEDVLLAPMESSVIPLPHQVEALARAVSSDKIRYLLADEVGLGKTIEAGLIIRELKLRGRAQRILIVAPSGLVTQWQMEMRTHFGEHFPILHPGPFTPYHHCYPEENVWAKHTQLICPLDAVKPLDSRKGWTQEQVDDYNRWRYADLITAGWDLVIIDEAHRLAGSTEQVARYKLGQGLAEAAPYVLLLSATPHQGKSDAFHRLMHLLDPATFAEAQNVTRERIRPFVIRTEKRRAIDDKGQPLFMPRQTLMLKVAWEERHNPQRDLYETITDYVREGYNLAMQENKRHLGFLMILMQRLVVSSTRAIRCTLERRLAVLVQNAADADARVQAENHDFGFEFMASLSKETLDVLHDMEGQTLLDALISLRENTRRNEEAQVAALLEQARRCEEAGQDAKAEVLFSWLYQLQTAEGDPELKCLIFTEFTATQDMLKDFLVARGFSVATLNGSMNQEERTRAQEAFRKEVRVLISTDAGGEGLNLQFCHVVINYDLPWNPMRLEQRIGRVDRIGQHKTVRAINMALEDTVEFRVREVLEEKLERILQEFGIDKSSDVLDSAQAGELFDEVFTSALLHPEKLAQTAYTTADNIRHELAELRESTAVYGMSSEPDCAVVERLRTHPLPHWLERMVINYIRAHGGMAEDSLLGWNLTWPDGRRQEHCVFSSHETHRIRKGQNTTVLSLEDSRIRALALHLPRSTPGLPLSCVTLPGLPPGTLGYWGLFEIRLQRTSGSDSALVQVPRHRSAYCALFVAEDGTLFMPTARHIWDTLQHAEPVLLGRLDHEQTTLVHTILEKAAQQAGAGLFESLMQEHTLALQRETLRGQNAFAARHRGIERVGLPEVRHHRLILCDADEKAWRDELHAAAQTVPELRPLLLMRIGGPAAEPPLQHDKATQ